MYLPTFNSINSIESESQIESHSFRTSKSRRNQYQNNGVNSTQTFTHNSVYRPPANGLVTRGTSRFCITNNYADISNGWGYGMWRNNVKDLYNIERDEEFRSKYLKSIREFGYDYLRPQGIKQTMRSMLEREAQINEQAERGEQVEFDTTNEQGQNQEQQEPIREDQDFQDHSEEHLQIENEDITQDVGNDRIIQDDNEDDIDQHEIDLDDAVHDLDAEIQEASDNSYDDSYNEDEYQEGFMADEEYDNGVDDVEDESELLPQIMVTNIQVTSPPHPSESNISFNHNLEDSIHESIYDISRSSIRIENDDNDSEEDISSMSFQ